MASPQKENGFTIIAHEILEQLTRTPLSGRELRIILLILRETYGRNRKEAPLSLREIQRRTGIAYPHVSQALSAMRVTKIVTVSRVTENGNRGKSILSFQKDYDQWGVTKTVTVTRVGNVSVPKTVTVARTRAKEEREEKTSIPYQGFLKTYNDNRGGLIEAREISEKRKPKVNAAFREKPDLTYWREVVCRLARSPGATGQNDRHWRGDIDFVMRNHVQIMEGKYDRWGISADQSPIQDQYAHLRARQIETVK